MPKKSKRSYDQYCSLARTLDLIGERWTLLIVRDLLGGPKRYKDLLNGLPGIGTNLLANRLKELEEAGLIENAVLPPPASVKAYRLTERGRELEAAVVALAHWGLNLLEEPRRDALWLPQWNHVALRARFNPDMAMDVDATYAFLIDDYPHYAVIKNGELTICEGQPADPAFILKARSDDFVRVLEGELSMEEAIANGTFILEGAPEALQRCMQIFTPDPV